MRGILFIIALLAIGPLSIWMNDDLVSDYELRGHTLVPAGISTTDRKCTGMPFLIYHCRFKFSAGGESQSKNYLLFAFGSPKTVYLMKSQQTGALTSSAGQEYFWNRVVAIVLSSAISILSALVLLLGVIGGGRQGRAAPATPQPRPAPGGHQLPGYPAPAARSTFGQR
ncbi:MAG: hypothetical protein AAF441_26445 [Pseudomonadota bacterium]